jgi:hypothetical protein
MGTGVDSHAFESAASIMRREAQRLRREIDRINEKIKDYDASASEERRKVEAISAEAQRLESAARVLEPGAVEYNNDAAATCESPAPPGAERRVPRFGASPIATPSVDHISIVARTVTGERLGASLITREEIEDGFLGVKGNAWPSDGVPGARLPAHGGAVWRRLRNLAGIE